MVQSSSSPSPGALRAKGCAMSEQNKRLETRDKRQEARDKRQQRVKTQLTKDGLSSSTKSMASIRSNSLCVCEHLIIALFSQRTRSSPANISSRAERDSTTILPIALFLTVLPATTDPAMHTQEKTCAQLKERRRRYYANQHYSASSAR